MHTEEYQKQLNLLHQTDSDWGRGGGRHAKELKVIVGRKRIRSILDYGCGKGELAKHLEGVTNYDPGVPEFSQKPEGKFDLVVASHVLEHIEPGQLSSTLAEINGLMGRFGYFIIPHGPAKAILPDGRNAHLIQEPKEWWSDTLKKVWPNITIIPTVVRTASKYWITK